MRVLLPVFVCRRNQNGKMREHFSRVKDDVLVAVQRRDAGRAQHGILFFKKECACGKMRSTKSFFQEGMRLRKMRSTESCFSRRNAREENRFEKRFFSLALPSFPKLLTPLHHPQRLSLRVPFSRRDGNIRRSTPRIQRFDDSQFQTANFRKTFQAADRRITGIRTRGFGKIIQHGVSMIGAERNPPVGTTSFLRRSCSSIIALTRPYISTQPSR